jgi:tRNA dimethylallyltransferase
MERIICVVGPTAAGKTQLAAELARALDGEVVSCDSMQIYRRMNIGTAKPTVEEMCGIPHHMIDIVEPDEDFSVGRYVQMAEEVLQGIFARGKTAVVAGGTGLYCDSLISGRAFAPCPQTGRRAELEKRPTDELLKKLQKIDPASAERLSPADRKRIVRALEVYEETGETITAHNEKTKLVPPRHRAVWLGVDWESRAELYARIDRRVDAMLAAGLLDEIRALLKEGIPETATSLQAIGYKEFILALHGECSVEDAAALVKQRSRNYAKRQRTWFRRNPETRWLLRTPEQDFSALFREARRDIPFFAD